MGAIALPGGDEPALRLPPDPGRTSEPRVRTFGSRHLACLIPTVTIDKTGFAGAAS
jgi:hypothetical protein